MLAGTFNAQDVANTLWAYATMGRVPGAGVIRALEGRAEALAGSFNAQGVANSLWAACVVFRFFSDPGQGDGCILLCSDWCPWVRLRASLPPTCASCASGSSVLCVVAAWSRGFVWRRSTTCSALKETCREAFECAPPSAPSATQQQVSETLRRHGAVVWRTRLAAQSRGIPSTWSCARVHDSSLGIGRERSSREGGVGSGV